MTKTDIKDIARGRWREILAGLGGVDENFLADEHGPCPFCAGRDRWRWDDIDGNGGGYCNQCGGQNGVGGFISGPDILMRAKGWSFAEAAKQIKQFLGVETVTESVTRPFRQAETPPADAAPPRLGRGAVAQWCYRLADGSQAFWVQRVNRGAGGKYFLLVIWLDGAWHTVTKRDPFRADWPEPRPLYRLPELLTKPDAPVVIAEGEKSVDAAAQLLPGHVAVGFRNGAKSAGKSDWSPLAGREVVLLPDNDPDGDEFVLRVTQQLRKVGVASISVCRPDPDAPAKWDIADGLAEGWGVADAELWLQGAELAAEPELEPVGEPEPLAGPADSPFVCLGFDDGNYYYQPNNTGQVIRLTGAGHTSTNLLRLARLSYWETIFPSKTGVDWTSAISSLFERQARAGVYSPDRIRGRGAWWDDGRCVLHLGDRLIVDGTPRSVMDPITSRFNYQRLASIDIPTDLPPLTDEEGLGLLQIASRFHWEVPASGVLLAGWAALAPICGALTWRPHAWLTASAGSGKSAILDRFLGTLLDSLALWPEGNTTEAFIRQELRADAMPVVFDEAESNERSDQARIQNILALARVASSSGRGVIGKGGSDGAAQRFTIRSMFLLCSISTALKQGADLSRFAQLTLRNPNHLPKEERQAHWYELDRDLTAMVTPEVGHRLLLRMVQLIPVIRESIAVFRRAAADRFDSQRQGDQYGTLLAGAWALQSSVPASEANAYAMIDGNDWEPYREATEQPDEERCLQHILQHQVRVETDHVEVIRGQVHNRSGSVMRTIWELIEAVKSDGETGDLSPETAESHLGRIGLRVQDGRLLVANTALGLQRILAETPWAHSWPTVLSRIPGASKPGKVRFKGMNGNSRAVSLPIA